MKPTLWDLKLNTNTQENNYILSAYFQGVTNYKQMKKYINPKREIWNEICRRPFSDLSEIRKNVDKVLEDIKLHGDDKLKYYSKLFDNYEGENIEVSDSEIEESEFQIADDLKKAIRTAHDNISKFHEMQIIPDKTIETMPGVICTLKNIPVQKVGLYVPGGTAPLLSTVLMLAIPAKIAGCEEIVMCTPPNKEGKIHPAILFSAKISGIAKIYKVGGSQAIAAMAYGTETIPKVYKIFGPGNKYVTTAKMIVSTQNIAIDMPAGPSEVLVVADDTANTEFVAADLLSQAEHDTDSQVILICNSEKLVDEILKKTDAQLEKLPRKEIAKTALSNSKAIIFDNPKDSYNFVNEYAPEHLIISVENPEKYSEKIKNTGSIFLGNYTPESAGDYASGTNHTLPTGAYAKSYSGVSLSSFIKTVTLQKITKKGLQEIGKTIELMAEAEFLQGHKNAVSVRLKDL